MAIAIVVSPMLEYFIMKKNYFPIILTVIFILSLIPLYIIGGYAHPSVDDYYYGVETAGVFKDTHSLSAVIKEAFSLTKQTYMDWQGNFAAIFLMRLQPAIFGEQYYVAAPVLLLTTFIFSMLIFFYTALRKWCNATGRTAYEAALIITFCALQFTYVPSDSFYWYNGSIYYTFFFSLMLMMFSLFIVLIKGKHTSARIISGILCLVLAFIIGGGNYATALFTSIVLVLFSIYYLSRKDAVSIPVILIMIMSLASLFISIKAPGNAIRQASVGGSQGVFKALVYSFAYGAYNIADSTTLAVAAMWLGLIPLFYRIAAGMKCSFKHPVFVLLFTFGIFCSQGTPVFYAQGLRMPYRMMNIIYFSYYIFMTINLIYIMGYIHNHYKESLPVRLIKNLNRHLVGIVLCIVFVTGCLGHVDVTQSDEGGALFLNMPASVSAAYSLLNGDAATYDNELNARNELLNGSLEDVIEVESLSKTPQIIFHTDITTDGMHWKNAHLALFYNKTQITLSR